MSAIKIFLGLYGAILLSGAYFGIKAGSKISLVMGLVSGILIFIGLYYAGIKPTCGYGLIASTSGLLVIVFLIRLIKTQSFMPSGMLLLFSMAAFIVSLYPLLQKSN